MAIVFVFNIMNALIAILGTDHLAPTLYLSELSVVLLLLSSCATIVLIFFLVSS